MAASPIRERSGQEFVASLTASGARLPLEGIVETTFRCNLNCVHCYVNLPAHDTQAAGRELPLARLLTLVDEIADAGTLTLLLTGGEVLSRRDFPELYEHAVERGLRVVVFTNGTLVTTRIAELFARCPPVLVEISIYGASAEVYESVTRVPGSHARCLEGVRRLLDAGVRLGLKTTLTRQNFGELQQMQALAESLGVPFRYDAELNARVDCGAPRHEQQVAPALIAAADLADPRRRDALRGMLAPQPAVAAPESLLYSCGAGRTGYTVDPYGSLQLCQTARRNGYDLTRGSFAAGWSSHLGGLIERRWQGSPVCRACSLRFGCGSCAGAAELETGDAERAVPAFCELTHRRAFGVLAEVPGHRPDATCCLAAPVAAAAAGER